VLETTPTPPTSQNRSSPWSKYKKELEKHYQEKWKDKWGAGVKGRAIVNLRLTPDKEAAHLY